MSNLSTRKVRGVGSLGPLALECSRCYQLCHTRFYLRGWQVEQQPWRSQLLSIPRRENLALTSYHNSGFLLQNSARVPSEEIEWPHPCGNRGAAPEGGIQGWLQWTARESWARRFFCSVSVFMCCSSGNRECIDPNELIICSFAPWLSITSVLEKDSKASDPALPVDVRSSWEIRSYVHGLHPKKDTQEPFKDSFYLLKAGSCTLPS